MFLVMLAFVLGGIGLACSALFGLTTLVAVYCGAVGAGLILLTYLAMAIELAFG